MGHISLLRTPPPFSPGALPHILPEFCSLLLLRLDSACRLLQVLPHNEGLSPLQPNISPIFHLDSEPSQILCKPPLPSPHFPPLFPAEPSVNTLPTAPPPPLWDSPGLEPLPPSYSPPGPSTCILHPRSVTSGPSWLLVSFQSPDSPSSSSPPQLPDLAFEAPPSPTRDVSTSILGARRVYTSLWPTHLTPFLGPLDIMASAHMHMRTHAQAHSAFGPQPSHLSLRHLTTFPVLRHGPWLLLLLLPTALRGCFRYHSPCPTVAPENPPRWAPPNKSTSPSPTQGRG